MQIGFSWAAVHSCLIRSKIFNVVESCFMGKGIFRMVYREFASSNATRRITHEQIWPSACQGGNYCANSLVPRVWHNSCYRQGIAAAHTPGICSTPSFGRAYYKSLRARLFMQCAGASGFQQSRANLTLTAPISPQCQRLSSHHTSGLTGGHSGLSLSGRVAAPLTNS